MKTLQSLKNSFVVRSGSNAHRYICFINGKLRSFQTQEKDIDSFIAELFGSLNSCFSLSGAQFARLAVTAALPLVLAMPAQALPTGGQSVAGDVTFSQPDANTLNISSSANKSIANFNTYNLAQHETVNYLLNGPNAWHLSRVIDQRSPSQIFGTINAPNGGKIFITNGSGIIFGATAQVNVGSLFASSMSITNQNFLNGNLIFRNDGTGAVVNEGTINIDKGGFAVLAGSAVENTGTITAREGQVHMAVGGQLTMNVDNGVLVDVVVDEALAKTAQDYLDAVRNAGTIDVDGGLAKLQTKLQADMYERAVNNEGRVQAQSVAFKNGVVEFSASGGNAIVDNSGTVDASGTLANADAGSIILNGDLTQNSGDLLAKGAIGGQGGHIEVLGDKVALVAQANIDASGDLGGGSVLIGGDFQGKGDTRTSDVTFVDKDVNIDVSAGSNGDGGKAIVWADDTTYFGGNITANGGSQSGDGGFVETSGKETLLFRGMVDASAANGDAGTLLLDPKNLTIIDNNILNNNGTLNSGSFTGTTVKTIGRATGGAGDNETITDLTITNILNAGTAVQLMANNDITVSQSINSSNSGSGNGGNSGNLELNAGRSIIFDANRTITLENANLTLLANQLPAGSANRDAGNGSVTFGSGSGFSLGNGSATINGQGITGSSVGMSASSVSMTSSNGINVSGNFNNTTVNATTTTGNIQLTANSNNNLKLGTINSAGTVALSAGNHVQFTGNATSNGNFTVTADTNDDGSGNITQAVGTTLKSNSGTISMDARNIILNGDVDARGTGVDGNVTLTSNSYDDSEFIPILNWSEDDIDSSITSTGNIWGDSVTLETKIAKSILFADGLEPQNTISVKNVTSTGTDATDGVTIISEDDIIVNGSVTGRNINLLANRYKDGSVLKTGDGGSLTVASGASVVAGSGTGGTLKFNDIDGDGIGELATGSTHSASGGGQAGKIVLTGTVANSGLIEAKGAGGGDIEITYNTKTLELTNVTLNASGAGAGSAGVVDKTGATIVSGAANIIEGAGGGGGGKIIVKTGASNGVTGTNANLTATEIQLNVPGTMNVSGKFNNTPFTGTVGNLTLTENTGALNLNALTTTGFANLSAAGNLNVNGVLSANQLFLKSGGTLDINAATTVTTDALLQTDALSVDNTVTVGNQLTLRNNTNSGPIGLGDAVIVASGIDLDNAELLKLSAAETVFGHTDNTGTIGVGNANLTTLGHVTLMSQGAIGGLGNTATPDATMGINKNLILTGGVNGAGSIKSLVSSGPLVVDLNGGQVSINANGASYLYLTDGGSVGNVNTRNSNFTLDSQGTVNLNGTVAGHEIEVNVLNAGGDLNVNNSVTGVNRVILTADNNVNLNGGVVSTTVSGPVYGNDGQVYLRAEKGSVSDTADGVTRVKTNSGSLRVLAGASSASGTVGNIGASGNPLNVEVGGVVSAGSINGGINIQANNGTSLNVGSINTTYGDIALTANGAGSIVDSDPGFETQYNVSTSGKVTLKTASGNIGGADNLEVNASNIEATTNTGNVNLYVSNYNSPGNTVTLGNIGGVNAGAVKITGDNFVNANPTHVVQAAGTSTNGQSVAMDVDGNIDVKGSVLSDTTLNLTATGNVVNNGTVDAGTHLTLDAGKQVVNNGIVDADGNVKFEADSTSQQAIHNKNTVRAGGNVQFLANNGGITTTASVTGNNVEFDAKGGNITLGANVTATNNLDLEASGNITQSAGLLKGGDASGNDIFRLAAGGNIGGGAGNPLDVEVWGANNLFTANSTGGNVWVHEATNVANVGASSAAGDFQLTSDGYMTVNGAISGNNVTLKAGMDPTETSGNGTDINLNNNVSATGTVNLTANEGSIHQKAGTAYLVKGNTLNASAKNDINSTSPIEIDVNTLTVNAGGNVDLHNLGNLSLQASTVGGEFKLQTAVQAADTGNLTVAGPVDAGSVNFIASGNVRNNAAITTDTHTVLDAAGQVINNGTVDADGNVRFEADSTVADAIDNNGTVTAGGTVDFLATAGGVDNTASVTGGGLVKFDSGADDTILNSGAVASTAAQVQFLAGGNIQNNVGGNVTGKTGVLFDAGNDIDNSAVVTAQTGDAVFQAGDDVSNSSTGQVYANDGDVKFLASDSVNNQGTVNARQNVLFDANTTIRDDAFTGIQNSGSVVAQKGDVTFDSRDDIENTGSVDATKGTVTFKGVGDVNNSGGLAVVTAGTDVIFDGDNIGNLKASGTASIRARRDVKFTAGHNILNQGEIDARNGNVTMVSAAGNITNEGGTITAGKDISLDANNIFNDVKLSSTPSIRAKRNILLTADADIVNHGEIRSNNGTITLDAGNDIFNEAAGLSTGFSIAEIIAERAISLTAGNDINNDGLIKSRTEDVGLIGGNRLFNDTNGEIRGDNILALATGSNLLALSADGSIVNNGLIKADNLVLLLSNGNVTNTGRVRGGLGVEVAAVGDILNQGTLKGDGFTGLLAMGGLRNSNTGRILGSDIYGVTVNGDIINDGIIGNKNTDNVLLMTLLSGNILGTGLTSGENISLNANGNIFFNTNATNLNVNATGHAIIDEANSVNLGDSTVGGVFGLTTHRRFPGLFDPHPNGTVVFTGTLTADGGFINSAGSILDDNSGTDLVSTSDFALLANGGTIGTFPNPLDVDVKGDLFVGAKKSLNGFSVVINGKVQPSNTLKPLFIPPGAVLFNGQYLFGNGPIKDLLTQGIPSMFYDYNYLVGNYQDFDSNDGVVNNDVFENVVAEIINRVGEPQPFDLRFIEEEGENGQPVLMLMMAE